MQPINTHMGIKILGVRAESWTVGAKKTFSALDVTTFGFGTQDFHSQLCFDRLHQIIRARSMLKIFLQTGVAHVLLTQAKSLRLVTSISPDFRVILDPPR